jgi:3-oxoacyl-[acyl-carrier-protein] synthase II
MAAEMKPRVVITGVGALSALGVGADALHSRWAAGECGIVDGAGACSEFAPESHLSVKEVRRLDRFSQLALVSAEEALRQAGWLPELPYDPFRIGCIVASGFGGIETLETQHAAMLRGGTSMISPFCIPQYMPNAGAAAVSMKHGLRGHMYNILSACSSGAHALGAAMRMIQCGDADAVVAGGAEASLTDLVFASFGSTGAMSSTRISRPFDARRDGFVMGEGSGMLVLEKESAARERGATILGELAGYGSTSDAHHLTAPEPTGAPAARAIELALEDAGVAHEDVSYINAHGTSTQRNDAGETAILKRVFGPEGAKKIPVSSTKSAIGHLIGAAGAVEAVATLQTLLTRVIPPTLGYEIEDPACDLDYVPWAARPLRPANGGPPVAISNSFAFGGHNVALVMRGADG